MAIHRSAQKHDADSSQSGQIRGRREWIRTWNHHIDNGEICPETLCLRHEIRRVGDVTDVFHPRFSETKTQPFADETMILDTDRTNMHCTVNPRT